MGQGCLFPVGIAHRFAPHPSSWDAISKSDFCCGYFHPHWYVPVLPHLRGSCLGDAVFILRPLVFSVGCFLALWLGRVTVPRQGLSLLQLLAPLWMCPFPGALPPRSRCQHFTFPAWFSGLLCCSGAVLNVGPTDP